MFTIVPTGHGFLVFWQVNDGSHNWYNMVIMFDGREGCMGLGEATIRVEIHKDLRSCSTKLTCHKTGSLRLLLQKSTLLTFAKIDHRDLCSRSTWVVGCMPQMEI